MRTPSRNAVRLKNLKGMPSSFLPPLLKTIHSSNGALRQVYIYIFSLLNNVTNFLLVSLQDVAAQSG